MLFSFPAATPSGQYDYCVIGSGPAGISLTRRLAAGGKRVLLLEAGDEQYTIDSQDAYKGRIAGDSYYDLDIARLRYFGGTSNHWSGWVRPMDAYDFEPKPFLPLAHWPISKSELDRYIDDTNEILELDALAPDFRVDEAFNDIGFDFTPVRFGLKYKDELAQAANVDVFLNANVTSLQTNGTAITAVEIAAYSGERASISADRYILATGGLENSRLLLWSNELANGALVPQGTPIGKYWMEHPHFTIGQAVVHNDIPYRVYPWARNASFFSLNRAAKRDSELLNCGLRLIPTDDEKSGAKALVADLACVAPQTARWLADLAGSDLICGLRIKASWEQQPQENSRIELGAEKDRFGMPRIDLYWHKTQFDYRAARVAGERLGEHLATNDLGRLHLDDWLIDESEFPEDDERGGFHHMGGTRMAESAQHGVVDSNSKVFGQENLYVAGSSVFSTGGHANPTYTIIQLALRLGDHLLATS